MGSNVAENDAADVTCLAVVPQSGHYTGQRHIASHPPTIVIPIAIAIVCCGFASASKRELRDILTFV